MPALHAHRVLLAAVTLGIVVLATPTHAQRDVDELRDRAAQGDATAQFNLARLYVTGTGVPQHHTEASSSTAQPLYPSSAKSKVFDEFARPVWKPGILSPEWVSRLS